MYNAFMRKIRHRIFFIWLLTYGLLLSLPIAGIVIAFFQSSRVIVEEVTRGHEASLNQIKSIIDDRLDETDRLAWEIGWNPTLITLMSQKPPFDVNDHFNIFQFHRISYIYLAVNNLIDDFYIFLPLTDAVLTPDAMYSDSREYLTLNHGPSLVYDEWLEKMRHYSKGEILPMANLSSQEDKSIYWLRSFPESETLPREAEVALRISDSYIESVLTENIWLPEVIIGIFDGKGDLLYSSRDSIPLQENLLSDFMDRNNYMYSYMKNDKTDWTYFSLIPEGQFLKQAKKIRLTLMLILITTYLIAFFILYFMTERNYKPIKRMVNIFDWEEGESEDSDELALIQRSVTELLDSQQSTSKENLIRRLINGRVTGALALEEALEQFGLDFGNKYFQVMMVYLEELEEDCGRISFFRETLYTLLQNTFRDFDLYTIEIKGAPVCLFVYDLPDNRKKIEKLSLELINVISGNHNMGAALSFSNVKDEANLINIAYDESQEALEYELYRGNRKISFYYDLPREVRQSALSSSIELETRFFNAVRINQFGTANDILQRDIDRIVDISSSFLLMKTRISGIINLIIDAVSELRGVISNDYSLQIQALLDCDNVKQIKTIISFLLTELEGEVKENQEQDSGPLHKQVDEYLKENFRDINLTVGEIALHFSVSESYLSTIYKKHVGYGLLQAIHKIRIAESKKVLKTNDANLNSIASMVGYFNDIALIRAFKRYEGISPGKFRDSLKKQQS